MKPQDSVLNIAVNLSRIGRWAYEGKTARISQFIADTQTYVDQIQNPNPRFSHTYERFLQDYEYLKSTPPNSTNWSETAFTWAAILTHRAKLA